MNVEATITVYAADVDEAIAQVHRKAKTVFGDHAYRINELVFGQGEAENADRITIWYATATVVSYVREANANPQILPSSEPYRSHGQ